MLLVNLWSLLVHSHQVAQNHDSCSLMATVVEVWDGFLFLVLISCTCTSISKWIDHMPWIVLAAVTWGWDFFRPSSCVVSIVVLLHMPCFEKMTDEWGWQKESNHLWLWQGPLFQWVHRATMIGKAWMAHFISNPRVLIFSFTMWNFCSPQKVSCELAYFKNCSLWGERVFFDNITSLKPLGVESSLFLGSSKLFLVVLRIAPVSGLYRKSPQ
jgi:hypothetical protein